MKKVLVIFDCFGVLCNKICSEYLKEKVSKETYSEIYRDIIDPAECGRISRKEVFRMLGKILGISADKVSADLDALIVPHSDLYPVIEKIREFADVAVLSNAYEGHAERIIEEFELAPLFDRIFLSWQHDMAKPNLDFYSYCVKAFDKEYDEIYMVDDTDKNLERLHEIGIKAIKYENPESVKSALRKYF